MAVERIQVGAGIVVFAVAAAHANPRRFWKPACAVALAGAVLVVSAFFP